MLAIFPGGTRRGFTFWKNPDVCRSLKGVLAALLCAFCWDWGTFLLFAGLKLIFDFYFAFHGGFGGILRSFLRFYACFFGFWFGSGSEIFVQRCLKSLHFLLQNWQNSVYDYFLAQFWWIVAHFWRGLAYFWLYALFQMIFSLIGTIFLLIFLFLHGFWAGLISFWTAFERFLSNFGAFWLLSGLWQGFCGNFLAF